MADNSYFKAIEAIVERANSGDILFPDDFTACGTLVAVRTGLSRLCLNGELSRFPKGIYYVPKYDKWDGTLREPSLDAFAQRNAESDNARIMPTGLYALNRLGLSTQVPTNIVYISDGSARQMNLAQGKVSLSAIAMS